MIDATGFENAASLESIDPVSIDIDRFDALFIDAGIRSLRIVVKNSDERGLQTCTLPSNQDVGQALVRMGMKDLHLSTPVYLTGKLADAVRRCLGHGEKILPAAALWVAADRLVDNGSVAVLEISASGYTVVGVNHTGRLHDDLLAANARCGAGCGINIDRVLQKLALSRSQVDTLLGRFLGSEGQARRREIQVRADRCGVFASSATISDKNQGIPIDFALAVTLKSEVVKACNKFTTPFETVWLTGGVFNWQFARDCAQDVLSDLGVRNVIHDSDGSLPIQGLVQLEKKIGRGRFIHVDSRVYTPKSPEPLPSFRPLEKRLLRDRLYHRHEDEPEFREGMAIVRDNPVFMGLDVGSTMAKVVLAVGAGKPILFKYAVSNAGDTIETIKTIFREIRNRGIDRLRVKKVGITGSARYQVQKVLVHIYPQLEGAVTVLVENYAHARGAIDYVRRHIRRLKDQGVASVNEKRCILVDVGGEDTKISTIDLERGELLDNAMNIKCSAGTGSLLDVLASLFDIPDMPTVSEMAYDATDALSINATCAVFLMENAIRLQAEGVSRDRILASAIWAVVENMAHSLWNQLDLPANAVALLHGQTMRGIPLTLATTHRLSRHVGGPVYGLVPPDPGHRACIGLINSMDTGCAMEATIPLEELIEHRFRKRIIQCRGIACGDPNARCNRSFLTSEKGQNKAVSVTLGGCSAVNERHGKKQRKRDAGNQDAYRRIWQIADGKMPRSEDPDRLVIPRSFCVSDWAFFFSRLFVPFGIPVHVDNVISVDISSAQSCMQVDTCAPHMGAVGQMIRLAGSSHGMILAPQIEFLPGRGDSLGRSCTINQGGMAVARGLANTKYPESRIHLFHLSLANMPVDEIAQQVYHRLTPVYAHYGVDLSFGSFRKLVNHAWRENAKMKRHVADQAAQIAEEAMAEGRSLALVIGREYVLHPGIYDSHVGRLLRDKHLTGIPSYILDITLNPDFDHLYWRNSHVIATLTDAVARKRLHQIVLHPGFQRLFHRVETANGQDLAMVQVSTFLCGPDSVTNPLVDELVKNRPFLRIQSDAVIQELAHLENRMNTYIKQLEQGLHKGEEGPSSGGFNMKILDIFSNREPIHPTTDAIYMPTLSDNRYVTSVIRGAGYTCIDNYNKNHDLSEAVKLGRSVVGDGVCAPLAAVYGDILNAIKDFQKRKKEGDPLVRDCKRLLIFNNKGMGPCRQGQYVETHKLHLHRDALFSTHDAACGQADGLVMNFLVGHENKGFAIDIPEWAYLRGIQGIILQGVMHQLLISGASQCSDFDEYQRFTGAFDRLVERIHGIQEHRPRPSKRILSLLQRYNSGSPLGWGLKFFAYRLYGRDLTRPIRRFANVWNRRPPEKGCMCIHIDGEVYMRVAQLEKVLKLLIGTLGFRQFHLTHSPLWGFLEYKLAGSIMRAKEHIREGRIQVRRAHSEAYREDRQTFVNKKKRQLMRFLAVNAFQRYILAYPLYHAARLAMPEPVIRVLDAAVPIIPTQRPGGELVPYIGEAATKLDKGYDLFLNIAPEGCMVSSMGEVLSPAILRASKKGKGIIRPLFSQQGDVDPDMLSLALLKSIGPYRLYGTSNQDK